MPLCCQGDAFYVVRMTFTLSGDALLCQDAFHVARGCPCVSLFLGIYQSGEICFPAFTSQESIYQSGKSASRLEAFFGPDGLLDSARTM